jgi:hypothetical protein
MFGKIKLYSMIALAIILVVSGFCLAEEPKASPAPAASVAPAVPSDVVVLEIESFTLVNGKIVENPDASGGKAVVATSMEFMATKDYNFQKLGFYEVVIFENAPNGGADAINIGVGDNGDLRTYPNEALDMGKFRPCIKKYLFEVKKVGVQTIRVFTSNEMGAFYDKIEIKLVKPT